MVTHITIVNSEWIAKPLYVGGLGFEYHYIWYMLPGSNLAWPMLYIPMNLHCETETRCVGQTLKPGLSKINGCRSIVNVQAYTCQR